MKCQIIKTILITVLLTILMTSQTVSAAPLHQSQFAYDTFDDNFTSPALWSYRILDSGPTGSEASQRLEITVPANSAGSNFAAWFDSTCLLHGDYDIQVDYQVLTWPNESGVRFGLTDQHANVHRMSSGTKPGDYDIPGGTNYYMTLFNTGAGWSASGITPTSDSFGKLRLVRAGDTITSFYFDNFNGVWVLDASNSIAFYADDTPFALGAWSADSVFTHQGVKIAFDNMMINQGELVCPPSVSINQATGQADPTSSSPILFTAIFNEPVNGFGDAAADVTLSGTAGATTATVTETAPYDGTTYTVAVSGMTASGTVIASIPAGAAMDANSQLTTASTSSDNTVSFNLVLPATGQITPVTATCTEFAAGTATDLDTIKYLITFSNRGAWVSEVDPVSFYYYSKVIAPAANFRIRVVQSINIQRWPGMFILQQYVYDSNCTAIIRRGTVDGIFIDFTVTNATPGAPYYVKLRYLANSVLKAPITSYPYPEVPYRFTTILNEVNTIRTSIDYVYFRPK